MDLPTSPLSPDETPRPIDALLAGYAAGTLEPHLHALIESHLILCDRNRAFVRALEDAAGAMLDGAPPPKPGDRAARDHVLAAIYTGGWYGQPRPKKLDPDLPEPLSKMIGMKLDDVPWRIVAPGLREYRVHEEDGLVASLLKIKAGRALPVHTHEGSEVTLVLKGGFSDESGHFARGDVAVADVTVDHKPVADPGEECVCFAVTDAPLRLTGPIGRLIDKFFRP